MSNIPRVGLALGSGSAKGFAHLGILKVLDREHIPIDLIAGSSIGSVFGALYASGADLSILEELCQHFRQQQLIDVTVPKLGLIKGERIEALIRLLTKNATFEELKIPLFVVAVDIERREEVVFNKGSVAEAVRASISIPGIFIPKRLNGRLLVDGGVLNRVPIDVLRRAGADVVIGVDLKYGGLSEGVKPVKNIFDVILTSIDLLEEDRNYREAADVLIEPEVAHIGLADFHKAEECIAIGVKAAEEALPKIKRLLDSKTNLWNKKNDIVVDKSN